MNREKWGEIKTNLKTLGKNQESYETLKEAYDACIFNFHKDFYGTYEEYVIEKVKFLEQLAILAAEVKDNPLDSIKYLDEALFLLDSVESVYPYVSPREIEELRKTYTNM